MKSVKILSILMVASLALGGALVLLTNNAEANDNISICVTLPWQKEMLNWIGGSQITVTQFIEAGVDPHGGESGIAIIVEASKSIAYFYIGAQMEWEVASIPILRESFPNMKMVNSSEGLTLLSTIHEDHDDADDGHGHGPIDGHVWTLPSNLLVIAENMKNALIDLDPENRIIYEAGFIAYTDRVKEIKGLADEKLLGKVGNKFLVWHSAWQYLSVGYGLNEISLESPSNSDLTEQDINNMGTIAKNEGSNRIFVGPQDPAWASEVKNSLLQYYNITVIGANPLAIEFLNELENFIINLGNSWNMGAI